jgi:hypothetical protein
MGLQSKRPASHIKSNALRKMCAEKLLLAEACPKLQTVKNIEVQCKLRTSFSFFASNYGLGTCCAASFAKNTATILAFLHLRGTYRCFYYAFHILDIALDSCVSFAPMHSPCQRKCKSINVCAAEVQTKFLAHCMQASSTLVVQTKWL